ncbi:MAG: HAD hydrolase-like protein [Pauljensenia sp.]
MPATPTWTCVLLDVDGTIVDSAAVVLRSFRETLAELGRPVPDDTTLRRFVGPPLWTSFAELGLSGEAVNAAVQRYREIYSALFLDPLIFPGVPELLQDLHAAGLTLSTATSKQEPMARAQIDHLGLSRLFAVVAGATPDPTSTKATVISSALARMEALGADTSRPVLLGDRMWDIQGARTVGIPVIGAGWGYAEPGELLGADAVAEDVGSARDLLLGSRPA